MEEQSTITPMKISPRSQRLASVIQGILPTLFPKYIGPDKVGFLTITAVEVSADLSVADIFVDSIGAPSGWVRHLNTLAPRLSSELSRMVQTRQALTLRFKKDKGADHVESLKGKL